MCIMQKMIKNILAPWKKWLFYSLKSIDWRLQDATQYKPVKSVSTFSRCTVLAEFRCKWSSCCRSVTWRRSSSLHARRLAWKHTQQHWHHIPDTIPDNMYCEIIYICWTFNFVFLVGRTINEFMISTNIYSL